MSSTLFFPPLHSDLGAHIDGFIAVAAHTIVVGASANQKITGRQADVILGAYWAVQAALRLLKSGANVSLHYCFPTTVPLCKKRIVCRDSPAIEHLNPCRDQLWQLLIALAHD